MTADGMCADCNLAADEYLTVAPEPPLPAIRLMTNQGVLILGSGPTRELRAYCNLCTWKGYRRWSAENSRDPMKAARTEARNHHASAHA